MQAYEGLFLVRESKASDDFRAVLDHIRTLLERRGASIKKLEKWESRRLAYRIKGKKRGTYVLTKFEADPAEIAPLRRDASLSNIIMRAMVLREEHVGTPLETEEEGRDKRRGPPKQEPKPEAGEESKEAPTQQPEQQPQPEAQPKPEEPPEEPGGTGQEAHPEGASRPEGEAKPDILGDHKTLEEPPAAEREP